MTVSATHTCRGCSQPVNGPHKCPGFIRPSTSAAAPAATASYSCPSCTRPRYVGQPHSCICTGCGLTCARVHYDAPPCTASHFGHGQVWMTAPSGSIPAGSLQTFSIAGAISDDSAQVRQARALESLVAELKTLNDLVRKVLAAR